MKFYVCLTILMLISAANSLVLFFNPPWANPFLCTLVAVSMPFGGAMLHALFDTEDGT